MGNTLMSLLVKLGVDSSDFTSGMDKAEGKAKSSASNIMGGLSNMGAGITGVLGGTALAAGAFLASTIGPASDLNETVSKTQVVFGESSKAVLKFGKTAATALGMSENAALGGAATFGNLFRAMEIGEKPSADMSLGLVQLAGDLASFNNLNPTDVLDKLRSGLSGETEPLKSLGININEALVKAKALELGLWDGIAPLTAAQKAQAVYALALEQTTLAQGDFARTSKGVANQQRILAAQFENIKATIGTALLPMLTALGTVLTEALASPDVQAGIKWITDKLTEFSTFVIDSIPGVIASFHAISQWFTDNPGVIVAGLAIITTAIVAWALTSAAAIAPLIVEMLPVIAVIALIGVAAYLLYSIWVNNWGGIQDKMAAVWNWLQPILGGIVSWFEDNIPKAIQVLAAFWQNTLLPAMVMVWDWMNAVLFPFLVTKFNELMVNGGAALSFLSELWSGTLWPAIQGVWSWMSTVLFPFLQSVSNFLGTVFGVAITAFAGLWQNVLWPAIQGVLDNLNKSLMPIFIAFSDWWNSTGQPVAKSIAEWIGNYIYNAFLNLTEILKIATAGFDILSKGLSGLKLPDWLTPKSGVELGAPVINGPILPGAPVPATQAPIPATTGAAGGGGLGAQGESGQPAAVYELPLSINGEVFHTLILDTVRNELR